MVTAPLLPYPTTEASHSMQYVIAGRSTRSMVLPGLTIFAGRNNGVCAASSDGIMAALGVVGAIPTDADDGFVHTNLVEQARQHWRITGRVVRDLNGANFQGRRINAKVHLAPLTAVVGTMFLRFPFTFTQHLDAGTIDQQVQPCRRRVRRNRHGEMFLSAAHGAEIRNFPIQAR